MRTTVTLDDDTAAHIRRVMDEQGLSFKETVNRAIRRGLAPAAGEVVETPTSRMGRPFVDVTKALRLAGELEDAELARELATRR